MHSTVYNVEGVEASNNLFNLLKEHDPDCNTSWFELGERAGIEIVDEEEVDAEVQEIEEDKEVESTMMPKISTGECWQVHVFLVYCQRCRRYCVQNIMFSIICIHVFLA